MAKITAIPPKEGEKTKWEDVTEGTLVAYGAEICVRCATGAIRLHNGLYVPDTNISGIFSILPKGTKVVLEQE
jgi:hypothetical protein